MQVCICAYSHDIHGDRGGQVLTDVFEEVIGGEEVGAPRDQVLLELQQLSTPTQKHLTHTHTPADYRSSDCSHVVNMTSGLLKQTINR